jgi:transketolase
VETASLKHSLSAQTWSANDAIDATRTYSEKCINALASALPGLLGGSADLAGSNKVYLKGYDDLSARTPWGRNIRYGVREHAMAGISNGIALHGGGLIPYASTFLVFSDYMKNAMRLSALSEAGVLYICTHDSIGLGEDGPTHQPVEQLIGLRAIPNMHVFRPADGNEVSGAYRAAILRRHAGPSVIALSRQKVLANIRGTSLLGVERGGYVVSDNNSKKAAAAAAAVVAGEDDDDDDDDDIPDGDGRDGIELILIGTGSELCLCENAAQTLRNEGKRIRVVSLVCWELFDEQDEEYRESVLPKHVKRRLAVEAGSPIGWKQYVGDIGCIIGVDKFGKSGAYLDVFKSYGFTPENVLQHARRLLQ